MVGESGAPFLLECRPVFRLGDDGRTGHVQNERFVDADGALSGGIGTELGAAAAPDGAGRRQNRVDRRSPRIRSPR